MLNSVILMGRLTADPGYRTTQSGATMARFTLAVERDYAQNGERQTDFLDVIHCRRRFADEARKNRTDNQLLL